MEISIQFDKNPLLFRDPIKIISCNSHGSFVSTFNEIEDSLNAGHYAAGFFSYEAGYSFEERLCEDKNRDFPLIYIGIYNKPSRDGKRRFHKKEPGEPTDLRLNITKELYSSHIESIRKHIEKGDVYQITYCIKLLFKYAGDPLGLYHSLLRAQPVPYPAYIDAGRFKILSLSPEKFLYKTGTHVVTKPMKGTWQRGAGFARDIFERTRFQYDMKNRAENIMIADLLRNDLGRVGTGIRAPTLFEIAAYKTLFQIE